MADGGRRFRGNVSAETRARRELGLTLLACAAGAGLVLIAATRPWAHARVGSSGPLPASIVAVSGRELLPAADALAVAAAACIAAVLATRGVARRAVGVILTVLGALTAVTAVASVRHAHVAAVAAAHALAGALSPGATRVTMAAFPWWFADVAGGVLIAAAGLAIAWRGTRWPAMSARYERPPGRGAPAAKQVTTAWDALDRGTDPTIGTSPNTDTRHPHN